MAGTPIVMTVTLTPMSTLIQSLMGRVDNSRQLMGLAIRDGMEVAMTQAKKDLVPVLTGALRDSGQVREPEIDADKVLVRGGFGGFSVNYAFEVHENPTSRHPHGQWKYWEQPLLAAIPDIRKRVEAALLDGMSKNVS